MKNQRQEKADKPVLRHQFFEEDEEAERKRLAVSISSVMTMETAPAENPEYAEERVAKKLTSVQTAKPNAQMKKSAESYKIYDQSTEY